MRLLAILISLAAPGVPLAADDAPLVKCEVGPHGGYLVSVAYAEKHRGDILATLPDEPQVDGFWKVSEQIAIIADRNLRETLENAVKDPTLLFPNLTVGKDASQPDSLEYQRNELKEILAHYGSYQRQFFGVIIDGHERVQLNYAMGTRQDPAKGFLFIQRIFEPDMHFLQARYNWDYDIKTISNVSMYGSWQESKP